MNNEKQEHWKTLCAQAAQEHDPEKLVKLLAEVERLLKEREKGKPAVNKNSRNRVRA
jgi:hypothetical protein